MAPDYRSRQKGEWRRDGLLLANRLRAANARLPKIEIARAISAEIEGAPRNIEAIAAWLRNREQDGQLRVHQGVNKQL